MADFARLPHPLPSQPAESLWAGIACRIAGGALAAELDPGQSILFNPQALLWKEPSIVLQQDAGGAMLAFGPGRIGFSHGVAGAIFPIPLSAGEAVQIRSGQFLFAAGAMLARETLQGLGDRLAGGAGSAADRFTASVEGGVVWVQAHGEVFERGLIEGEPFDVQPRAWLCKDPGVGLEAIYPTDDPGARFEIACLRLTGPGRIALQTQALPVAAIETARLAEPSRPGLRAVAGSLLGRLQG